jgi:hypothetical protein
MASFQASRAALDQVAGGYSIVDSAANIQPNLAALQADASHIASVSLTSGVVTVNVAAFLAEQAVLNKIVGGFAVADTGANVQAQLGALEQDAGQIKSVTLNDSTAASPGVLTLKAADARADAAILAKVASPYVLETIATTGATLAGHGVGLTIDIDNLGVSTITGGAGGDEFYFSPHFGNATITDFAQYSSGAKPDVLLLSTTDFANWSTLLADGRQLGANTVFTAADGSSLTLDGFSLSALQHASPALQAEFKFHA